MAIKKECPACGKIFKTYPSQDRKTCSLKCRKQHQLNSKYITRECLNCQQYFRLRNCHKDIQTYRYKTCSNNCYDEYINKIEQNRIYKRTHICSNCKQIFTAKRHNKTAMVFCSQKCSKEYMVGEKSPFFIDGISTHAGGYLVKRVGRKKQQLLHRHVMEQHLGRELLEEEQVHHKDGNKINNDIKNLEIMTCAEHARLHARTRYQKEISDEKV